MIAAPDTGRAESTLDVVGSGVGRTAEPVPSDEHPAASDTTVTTPMSDARARELALGRADARLGPADRCVTCLPVRRRVGRRDRVAGSCVSAESRMGQRSR